MTRTTSKMAIIATIAISLMCCFETINSAATGYYYQTPISQFNMPQFSTMPSTGPFIPIGTNKIGKALDDIYVINGRQLHQYRVHEDIDNDIDQPVETFIPPNFFVSNYHAKIGPTHPLGDQFDVETRFGGTQPNNQQQQVVTNAIALGSGGLGFVRLPNGNVYLGSGSLGYISSLRRTQDVQEARTRIESRSPDALHFGHGPLTDSLIYQSN